MASHSETLRMIEVIANEKDIPLEDIFTALEAALAAAISKRMNFNVRVVFDRSGGHYKVFRRWQVVLNQDTFLDQESRVVEFDSALHVVLEDAKKTNQTLKVGDFIEEFIEPRGLGRIAAQIAKQVILQKVREAERTQIARIYKDHLGQLVMGVVKRTMREHIIVDLGENAEAILLRTEMLPREAFRIGDRIRGYLYDVRHDLKGPQLFISRTCKEMLMALFRIEVPEINEDIIKIKAVARDPGLRAKVAVKTNDGRIDPIGACIGMRGARVQAVSNELNGERVDVILWDDNPAQFVINAMAPAEVASIVIDEDEHAMDIAVEEAQLSQAIGRNGQNIRLASEISGWALNVMTVAEMEQKSTKEAQSIIALFTEGLDVDEEVARVLVSEGFTNLEEIAYVAEKELLSIAGFDQDLVKELQKRAKDNLAKQADKSAVTVSSRLLTLEGVDEKLAELLVAHGIDTIEALAEQSVDDLLEIANINEQHAAKLIMSARQPWFSDNN